MRNGGSHTQTGTFVNVRKEQIGRWKTRHFSSLLQLVPQEFHNARPDRREHPSRTMPRFLRAFTRRARAQKPPTPRHDEHWADHIVFDEPAIRLISELRAEQRTAAAECAAAKQQADQSRQQALELESKLASLNATKDATRHDQEFAQLHDQLFRAQDALEAQRDAQARELEARDSEIEALKARVEKAGLVGTECVVCMSARVSTVLIPCGHLCMCSGCAESMASTAAADANHAASEGEPPSGFPCPLCRVTVASTQRVFLPTITASERQARDELDTPMPLDPGDIICALANPVCQSPAEDTSDLMRMEAAKALRAELQRKGLPTSGEVSALAPRALAAGLVTKRLFAKLKEKDRLTEAQPLRRAIEAALA